MLQPVNNGWILRSVKSLVIQNIYANLTHFTFNQLYGMEIFNF